jgi:hypothetical protein
MYCWGRRARAALDAGGTIEVRYGFRRRGRGRWISRRVGTDRPHDRRVTGADVALPPAAAADEGAVDTADAPVRVSVGRADVGTGDALSFAVSIASAGAPARIYLRDDLVRFRVQGPLGSVECGVEVQTIVPIIDFYRRLRGRVRATTHIAARRWCPDGTFTAAGIYEVTPVVDLVYDGERYGIEVVTGLFEGEPTPVRVRRGARPYLEQIPEGDADVEPPAAERVL